MIQIKGKYNTAVVFTDNIEAGAAQQIETLCDQEFVLGSRIRVMPDVHSGAGCTIGTTMTVRDKVVPNLVGVDIGCGMEVVKLGNSQLNLDKLDRLIHARIPSGFDIRAREHSFIDRIDLLNLRCRDNVDLKRARRSIGTLGGGNHFIEVNRSNDGSLYLVVHSGSRHLGHQVASYYQRQAVKSLKDKVKEKGRSSQAESGAGDSLWVPKALAFLYGPLYEDYLHDMKLIQYFALLNRKAILEEIISGIKLDVLEEFTTIHNYIDTDSMILRKGAVSARKGEKLLIPINMRDGSLICVGKGNPEWNYSAPHGAGRIMSRTQAKSTFTLAQFEKTMEGIYTTTANKDTLDECPLAYKPMEEIIRNVGDTVEIVEQIVPLYNFKSAE